MQMEQTMLNNVVLCNQIWLVTGTVYKTPYMGKETTFTDTRIVIAPDKQTAEDIVIRYWEDKSDSYFSYWILIDTCNQALS